MSEIVLSGIRATGKLHLGNYLGAMVQFVKLQEEDDTKCFFFIADYHTLTTAPDPNELRNYLPGIAAGYIAAGLDPERSTLYAQSSVPEIAELALLLGNVTPVQELLRLPTYREKVDKQPENVNFGLLGYPVLMAADILGPKATTVPVGKDQLKHVELARDLARRFNNLYGETFVLPQATEEESIIVPGLDGSGKMGKSEGNTIDLLDEPERLWAKLKVAVTDTQRRMRKDPGRPDHCDIYGIHQLTTDGEKLRDIFQGCTSAGIGCLDCKRVLADQISNKLAPYRDRYHEITRKPGYVQEVLQEGGKRARRVFTETLREVRERMGLPVLPAAST